MRMCWSALVVSGTLLALASAACSSSDDAAAGAGGADGSGGAVGAGGAGGAGGSSSTGGHGGHVVKRDGGASGDAAVDAPPAEPPNSVRLVVAYAGGKSGTMHVGLWKGATYVGGPDSSKVDEFPTFPYEVQLLSVLAGDYTLTTYLDLGSDDPDKPGADDPAATGAAPVHVTDQVGARVEITLVDP